MTSFGWILSIASACSGFFGLAARVHFHDASTADRVKVVDPGDDILKSALQDGLQFSAAEASDWLPDFKNALLVPQCVIFKSVRKDSHLKAIYENVRMSGDAERVTAKQEWMDKEVNNIEDCGPSCKDYFGNSDPGESTEAACRGKYMKLPVDGEDSDEEEDAGNMLDGADEPADWCGFMKHPSGQAHATVTCKVVKKGTATTAEEMFNQAQDSKLPAMEGFASIDDAFKQRWFIMGYSDKEMLEGTLFAGDASYATILNAAIRSTPVMPVDTLKAKGRVAPTRIGGFVKKEWVDEVDTFATEFRLDRWKPHSVEFENIYHPNRGSLRHAAELNKDKDIVLFLATPFILEQAGGTPGNDSPFCLGTFQNYVSTEGQASFRDSPLLFNWAQPLHNGFAGMVSDGYRSDTVTMLQNLVRPIYRSRCKYLEEADQRHREHSLSEKWYGVAASRHSAFDALVSRYCKGQELCTLPEEVRDWGSDFCPSDLEVRVLKADARILANAHAFCFDPETEDTCQSATPRQGVTDEKVCCSDTELAESLETCYCKLQYSDPHFGQLKEILQAGESNPYFKRPTCISSEAALCRSGAENAACGVVADWLRDNPAIEEVMEDDEQEDDDDNADEEDGDNAEDDELPLYDDELQNEQVDGHEDEMEGVVSAPTRDDTTRKPGLKKPKSIKDRQAEAFLTQHAGTFFILKKVPKKQVIASQEANFNMIFDFDHGYVGADGVIKCKANKQECKLVKNQLTLTSKVKRPDDSDKVTFVKELKSGNQITAIYMSTDANRKKGFTQRPYDWTAIWKGSGKQFARSFAAFNAQASLASVIKLKIKPYR